jgi:uncharacterized protein YukJ
LPGSKPANNTNIKDIPEKYMKNAFKQAQAVLYNQGKTLLPSNHKQA